MARFPPQWLDAPASYASQYDRALLLSMFPAVGVRGMAATVVANTMQINLGAGAGVGPLVDGIGAVHLATDGVGENIVINTQASGANRIDTVVARYRSATQDWVWAANQSSAVANPVAPGPTAPNTGGIDIPLYNVYVGGGAAALQASNLTDIRPPMRTSTWPRYQARMACTTAASVGASTAVIPFNVDTFDPYSLTTLGSGAYYACPVAGWYMVSGQFVSTSATSTVTITIMKNGAITNGAIGWTGPTTGSYNGCSVTDLIQCVAGDHLSLGASSSPTTAPLYTGANAANLNYMSVMLETIT